MTFFTDRVVLTFDALLTAPLELANQLHPNPRVFYFHPTHVTSDFVRQNWNAVRNLCRDNFEGGVCVFCRAPDERDGDPPNDSYPHNYINACVSNHSEATEVRNIWRQSYKDGGYVLQYYIIASMPEYMKNRLESNIRDLGTLSEPVFVTNEDPRALQDGEAQRLHRLFFNFIPNPELSLFPSLPPDNTI